jgi:hypothetical protein
MESEVFDLQKSLWENVIREVLQRGDLVRIGGQGECVGFVEEFDGFRVADEGLVNRDGSFARGFSI